MDGYVPAHKRGDLRHEHVDVLRNGVQVAGNVMSQGQQTHYARSDDSAMTLAMASLLYAAGLAVPAALITGGIFLIAYMVIGRGDAGIWAMSFLVVWGCCVLGAMLWNRKIGLWHSPTGIAHHEIDSRERVAIHAIDAHLAIVEKQLGMTDEPTPRIAVSKRLHQDA
jgi:hypothetical protein